MVCLKCKEVIPSNWVQQGGCHMACYDSYINEEVMVWKVECDGSSYIHEGSSIDLTMLSDGETARVVKVKRIDLLGMKEFTGF
jgi:hypothetical protein